MNNKPSLIDETEIESISFWQAFKFWLKLGFISFGGPAGQIAVMHQELVEEKKMDFRTAFYARIELLHAPTRPGGSTTCHLYWLVNA